MTDLGTVLVWLSLSALSQAPSDELSPLTMEAFWKKLEGYGFNVRSEHFSADTRFVTINGRVFVFQLRDHNERGEETGFVRSFHVSHRYLWENPKGIVDYHARLPKEPWRCRIGLDGTVTLRRLREMKGMSEAVFQAALLELSDDAERLEKSFLGAGTWEEIPLHKPPPLRKLDERRVIKTIDQLDMDYLVRLWGWEYNKPWGGSGAAWKVMSEVDGVKVWFSGGGHLTGHEDLAPEDFIALTIRFTVPPGETPAKWVAARKRLLAIGELDVLYSDEAALRYIIVLKKGKSLAEIKQTARAVAIQAKRIAASLPRGG